MKILDRERETEMSKNKKILTTTAAVAAATTGAMVATTVHADTTATSAQADQPAVSAQDQLNNLQAQHSQAENQLASANAQEMASATTDTNQQVAKLEDQLKDNQASQAAEDASKLAAGTKAINHQASEATAKENAAYADAVKSQEAANQQALAEATKNIYTPAQKQQLENAKTSQYKQDQAKLDQAHQTKLNSLKADHDQQATKLNDQIKAHQTAEQNAKDQAAAQASAKLDAQIKDANTTVADLNKAINNDNNAVEAAQDSLNQANSDVQTAQSNLDNTKKQSSQRSSQQSLPEIDVDTLGQSPEDVRNSAFVVNFMRWSDTDPVDQRKATFDANGQLTGQDTIEINIFATNVLNEIRQQIGTPLLHVSQKSIDLATTGAKLNSDQYPGVALGHDDNLLYQLENQFELNGITECAIDDGTYGDPSSYSIADLKNKIYEQLTDFINKDGDSNNGHRDFLLGVKHPDFTYFGMNFDPNGTNGARWYTAQMIDESQTDYPSAGQSTPAPDLTALTTALSQAQSRQSAAQNALDSAKSKLSYDQDLLTKAQAKLNDLNNQKNNQSDDFKTTDSPAVKALKKQLAELESSYAANVKDENDAYNKQKSDLDAKYQKELDPIKAYPENADQLKQEQAQKLAQLKKDHEAKLAQIKADAAQQIATLKQELADPHNDGNQPIVDKINALKAALAAKQDQLNQKLADLKANDAAEYNVLRDQLLPKQAVASVVSGVNSSYLTAAGQVVSLATKSGHSASSEAAALPQTGNNSSIAAAILGAASIMFGFGLMKKRGQD